MEEKALIEADVAVLGTRYWEALVKQLENEIMDQVSICLIPKTPIKKSFWYKLHIKNYAQS